MGAKIIAAQDSVAPGASCVGCIVACGANLNIIRSVLDAEYDPKLGVAGTLFAQPGSDIEALAVVEQANEEGTSKEEMSNSARLMATAARTEARKLQSLSVDERRKILNAVADAVVSEQKDILN